MTCARSQNSRSAAKRAAKTRCLTARAPWESWCLPAGLPAEVEQVDRSISIVRLAPLAVYHQRRISAHHSQRASLP